MGVDVSGLIKRAGKYRISADAYHADPCETPSLSRSVSVTLLTRSPKHAWASHPRLSSRFKREHKKHMDIGTAAHDMILGEPDRFMVVKADSYTGFAARRKRDTARDMGLVPLLQSDLPRIKELVAEARAQLADTEDASSAFLEGEAELTLVWSEDVTLADGTKFKIWCRCRLDWYTPGSAFFPDFKTTGMSANPETWGNLLFREGLDFQAAFYRRGITKVLKVAKSKVRFGFCVIETEWPHCLSVVGLGPVAMDLADKKVQAAYQLWGECMKANSWPGYPRRTCYVDPPVWAEKSWQDREDREYADRSEGRSQLEGMIRWQAPLDHPMGNKK